MRSVKVPFAEAVGVGVGVGVRLGVGDGVGVGAGAGKTVIPVVPCELMYAPAFDAVAVIVQVVDCEKFGAVKFVWYSPLPCSLVAVNVPPLFDVKVTVAPVIGLLLTVTVAVRSSVFPLVTLLALLFKLTVNVE